MTPNDDEVTVTVAVDADELAPGIVHDLQVTFAVPEGQHLYRDPVPPGMVAAAVELETEGTGLIPRPMVAPPTRPFTLSGTGDVLQVYEGSVVLTVPFTHNGSGSITTTSGREVAVRGVVRWQACDDEACGLPRRMSFDLRLPVGVNPRPDIGRAGGPGHRPMNGDAHFARMTERRR
ncbi:MAG: protein-disulfide reductase DsbD domain-containing protein [Actinomycetota bacterium]